MEDRFDDELEQEWAAGETADEEVETALGGVGPGDVLELIRKRQARGLTVNQLVAHVTGQSGCGRSRARRWVRQVVRCMERRGEVVLGRGKRYFALEFTDLVSGRVATSADGHGLVAGEDDRPPIRVPRKALRGALDGDRVLVRLERPRRRARDEGVREGVVLRVLERQRKVVVGRWRSGPGRSHVRPFDRKLRFSVVAELSEGCGEPEDGELVVVSLDDVDSVGRVRGRVLERLGQLDEPGVAERAVVRSFDLSEEFPPEVQEEAERLPAVIASEVLEGRWDLRDEPVITIDGETARDFDDAVSAAPGRGDDIVVGVHIADVSHYVRPGTALDAAARARSTSVYLPGLCLPMLPPRVSNQLCCLREGEDRLTVTARFAVNPEGEITAFEHHPSVIRSRRRCTYTEVFEWLEAPRSEWPQETAAFADSLALLAEAADRLGQARHRRGSLDFDLAEPEILLDPEGRVVSIQPSARNRAHRLIEELMVAANRCVAAWLVEREVPALHRVHDPPDPVRIEDLRETLDEFGFRLDGDPRHLPPASLQAVLERISGLAGERLLATLVLRSLARALYSPEPRGHYALALDDYLHFTSPIRRYPDLICHRALRLATSHPGAVEIGSAEMERLGESCSLAEQRAEAAERLAVLFKTVLFLRDRVGEVFAGHVSGVTPFGLFVQLDEFFVDGLIHVSELEDDFYLHDPVGHRLVGERTRRAWRLGEGVTVRLVGVDLDAMQVRVAPVGVRPDKRARRSRRGR